LSLRSIRLAQEAHVMPVISSSTDWSVRVDGVVRTAEFVVEAQEHA
jgi:hypothetical protein